MQVGVPTDASSEGVETGSNSVAARRREKPILEVVGVAMRDLELNIRS